MKKYAVLFCPDPQGKSDKPREFVGESDSFKVATIIKGKYIKRDPYEHKRCIIVDTNSDDGNSDDGNHAFVMDLKGVRSSTVISICSVFNAYHKAGKLKDSDFKTT